MSELAVQGKDWIAGANPGKMVGVLLAANSAFESQQLQKVRVLASVSDCAC